MKSDKKVLNKALIHRRSYLKMKIQLPNGEKIKLEDNISLEEKKKVVKELTDEWQDIIKADRKTWFSNAVKYFLDALSNYLVWHKDDVNDITEDKEVMSRNKTNRVAKGRKEMPFSCLADKDKELLFGDTRRYEK